MTLNQTIQPILRRKQGESHETDREGILKLCLHYNGSPIISSFYTRVDQVFLVWGLITAIIFCTAQFLSLRWSDQAILWSALTFLGGLLYSPLILDLGQSRIPTLGRLCLDWSNHWWH